MVVNSQRSLRARSVHFRLITSDVGVPTQCAQSFREDKTLSPETKEKTIKSRVTEQHCLCQENANNPSLKVSSSLWISSHTMWNDRSRLRNQPPTVIWLYGRYINVEMRHDVVVYVVILVKFTHRHMLVCGHRTGSIHSGVD